MINKLKVIILANEIENDHELWVNACKRYEEFISYKIINLTKSDWLEKITSEKVDILFAKPGPISPKFKQLYDERIYILENELGYKIFPNAKEIFIYENKRFFSFWLEANKIPHPKTYIFYFEDEAEEFINNSSFPIVGKVNIGASGRGVSILHNIREAGKYVQDSFSGKGTYLKWGPDLKKGNKFKRILDLITNPSLIKKKMNIYSSRINERQTGFVIFQEFIPHEYEWRVVRIGDSFFAHKKLLKGEKASGSLLKGYENPPLEIFDFVKKITDEHKFYSQAIDIFEIAKGQYLVNEMQCIFGQSDPYQMLVDGVEGRYAFYNGKWVFEPGQFNTNQCYDLRVKYILDKHFGSA